MPKTDLKYNILILLFTIMITFAAFELFFRAFVKDKILWEPDDLVGHRHIPGKTGYRCDKEFCNKFKINSQGFIDNEFSVEKKPNETRILIFGDSMMAAMQVDFENSTHRLLEKKLKERNQNVEVYNFGVSGFGTVQYLLLLKKYGPIYKPDITIFVFTLNDLRDINIKLYSTKCWPFFELENSTLKLIKSSCPKKHPILTSILKKSRFLSWAKSKISNVINQRRLELKSVHPAYAFQKGNPDFEKSFLVNERIIMEAKKISDEAGSKFIYVTGANVEQVNLSKFNEFLESEQGLKEKEWDLEQPDTRIHAFCQRENLSCLHLLPVFREQFNSTGKPLHFNFDIHWNEEGHKIAVEEIYKYLIKEKFIK